MKNKIRIASGQGFWGDLIDAPIHQVTKGDVDYLVMDYLAEVTMSILQKQKNKNPKLGYAQDIPELMKKILPICKEKGIKIITNGGGVNPVCCADAILEVAVSMGIKNLEVAVVLVSWNFKHIVNLDRIRKYNAVNLMNGYPMLEIRNPREILK